ncbi:uncharacterized protein LOC114431861 [Parambassis ranga]|uniref:Uncharacterized protein LOC114431861 n=1 Tax=Parambassis ranga TaxID=210632 RepID=A0A6P7HTF8_9TELE|nr:uncharacterized protein LOC114431861 [Parambassis ranga]
MRADIFCLLLACAVGRSAAADVLTVGEKQAVTLRCPLPVKNSVTWSRERGAGKENILTVHLESDVKHISDPHRRYSSQADNSLFILRTEVSDSGTYFCNDTAAVTLTVTSPGQTAAPPTTTRTHNHSTTPREEDGGVPTHEQLLLDLPLKIGVPLFILLILIGAVVAWRRGCEHRGGTEHHVYEEIEGAAGGGGRPVYSAAHFSCDSGPNDPTYCIISHRPHSAHNACSSEPTDATYVLLEHPKAASTTKEARL